MAGDDQKGDLKGQAADFMKKVLTVGVGTLFLSEDGLKGLISEFKLPKELLSGLLEKAGETRKEFLRTLSQDVISRISDRVDPASVLQEFLSKNELEFTIKVNSRPKAPSKPKGNE